jgi:hypothetical protein
MIGYDMGARFEPDEDLTSPLGDVDAEYSKNFEHWLPAEGLMHATPEMGMLPSFSNAAEPNAAFTAASELLAGMPGLGGKDREPEADALAESGGPSIISADGNDPGALHQMVTRYGGDGTGASVGRALAALFHPDYGRMLSNMPAGFGETTGSGNADMFGNAASDSIVLPIQNSNLEGSGSSWGNGATSAVEISQGHSYVPDLPGLSMDPFDDENGYPQLPQAAERGEEPGSVPGATGRFDHWTNLETSYGSLATNIAGGRSNEASEFAPAGIVVNKSAKSESDASEHAGFFQDEMGAFNHRNSGLLESDEKVPYDRLVDALQGAFLEGPLRSSAAKENDAAEIGSRITDVNRRFDQLTGLGAMGIDRRETAEDGGIGHKSSLLLPEGAGINAGEALRSHSDFSTLLPSNKTPDDDGISGLAGMWDILRHAERFLPQQSTAGAATGLSDGPKIGLPGLFGMLIGKGNVDELDPEPLAPRTSAGGGRSGPSGHKNDPIYMVAVNQASGTLMPTVATAGTGTRSPAMPGQRNLP